MKGFKEVREVIVKLFTTVNLSEKNMQKIPVYVRENKNRHPFK